MVLEYLNELISIHKVSPYYNISLDVAAIVLYVLMIIVYFSRPHIKDTIHKIYIALFTCSTLTPVFDIGSAICIVHNVHYVCTLIFTNLYYIGIQGITFCFLIYVVYQLDQYQKITIWKKCIIGTPLILMLILLASNDFTGLLFSYSVEDGYVHGPLHFISYVTAILYFLCTFYYINRHKSAYDKHFVLNIWNISFINIISIVVQFLFPNILINNFGFAVSMVLLNLFSHTQNTAIDVHTGMMNRDSLLDIGLKMIYAKAPFTLLMVKLVEYDTLVTIYGDNYTKKLIQNISTKLRSFFNVGDAFKVTKDAFIFIIRNEDTIEELKEQIDQIFQNYWKIAEQEVNVSYLMTSINYPEKISSREDLMSVVSHFEAIENGRTGYVPAEDLHFRDIVYETKIERAIIRGLENKNFTVCYQPMCKTSDRKFLTAEALLRLNDPDMGFIPPDKFIPVAEHCGYIVPIGNYVLDSVCDFIKRHDMEKLGLEYIEVNLSVIQCMQNDFIETVEKIISKHGVDSKYLCFEITETGSTYSNEVFLANLKNLVNKGHELALDDFGTGYSNLQRMVTTDFNIVKFDKVMTQQACSSEILKSAFTKLIALFHSLSLKVVAEGVETQEQHDFLCQAGIDYIQGFYFSKPVDEQKFVAYLETHN